MASKSNISVFLHIILFLCLFLKAQAQDPLDGYTLYPSGKNAYLYDTDKNRINTYTSSYNCMASAYLLRDSSVLFPGKNTAGMSPMHAGGQFQIIKWDGEVAWDFQYASSSYCPKYDCCPIYYTDDPKETPNVLTICEEQVGGTKYDKLVEIKPTGNTTGEVVWEWHVKDHTTSNTNDTPELFNANQCTASNTHINSIGYIQELMQVVIGVSYYNEIMVLDKSTTTQEAAGNTGGTYGKGGDILYRWGKPSNYGCSGNNYLDKFHGANGIPLVFPGTTDPTPGGGNLLLLFNSASDIIEIQPPRNPDGSFIRNPGEAFGPDEPTWIYNGSGFNSHQGSCQRLPNGNTFISNWSGDIFEVTESGEEVWSMNVTANKAWRYPLTYFDEVTPVKEKNKNLYKNQGFHIYSNPITGAVHISLNNMKNNATVQIFSLKGQEAFSAVINKNHFLWNAKNQASGIYIVKLKIEESVFKKYINLFK